MSTHAASPAAILFVATSAIAREWFTEASSGVVVAVCVASIADAVNVAPSLEPDFAVVLLSELDGTIPTFVDGLRRSSTVADLPVITVGEADRATFKMLLRGLVSAIPDMRQQRSTRLTETTDAASLSEKTHFRKC
jgi:hypothetical protein